MKRGRYDVLEDGCREGSRDCDQIHQYKVHGQTLGLRKLVRSMDGRRVHRGNLEEWS